MMTDHVNGETRGMGMHCFWAPAEPLSAFYDIEARIDPEQQTITGSETVTLVNRSSAPLKRLAVIKGLAKQATLSLQMNGQKPGLTPQPEEAEADLPVVVELPEALDPDNAVQLQMQFQGPLPQPRYGALMLENWHPRLWWGYPVHDDFEVRIKVPAGWQLAASGRRESPGGPWRGTGILSFGIVLANDFEVEEADAGETLVRCLFKPAARECAELLLRTAVDAVNFYRSEFGFYPQPFVSIVPGMDRPAGGFPFATGIVAVHGEQQFDQRPRDRWRWITAHEIGHQYWGEHVVAEDFLGEGLPTAWLSIGLGIYMDREFSRARGLDRGLHPAIVQRYLDGVKKGLDTTAARTAEQLEKINYDFNNVVTHGKGFAVISALESVVGKDAFRRIHGRLLAEFKGKRLSPHTFQMVCEEETGQDLEWFFTQWVQSNRFLAYRITSAERVQKGDRFVTQVRVERVGTLEMPIPVEARFTDGSTQRAVTDRLLAVSTLTFESTAPFHEAVLDPEGALAMLEEDPHKAERELDRELSQLPWTGVGEKAKELFTRAQECNLSNEGSWFKVGMLLYDGGYYGEALEAFRRLGELAVHDSYKFMAWVWQGHALDLLARRDEALNCYRKAQDMKFGGYIRHDQYVIVLDADWVEQRLKTPFQRQGPN